MPSTFRCVRRTPFGPVAILWAEVDGRAKVQYVLISTPGEGAKERAAALYPHARTASCAEIAAVADDIAAFLNGEDVCFDLDMTCLDGCTVFQQRVLRAEYAIPRGRVSSYGRVAAHVGNAGAARAVGTVLATNPFPIIIPCHRAVRSDGALGGYQGGVDMKRALLEMEGVAFEASGRVEGACSYY